MLKLRLFGFALLGSMLLLMSSEKSVLMAAPATWSTDIMAKSNYTVGETYIYIEVWVEFTCPGAGNYVRCDIFDENKGDYGEWREMDCGLGAAIPPPLKYFQTTQQVPHTSSIWFTYQVLKTSDWGQYIINNTGDNRVWVTGYILDSLLNTKATDSDWAIAAE
jgi:hypothetical protein